jgi:hypothetical protein
MCGENYGGLTMADIFKKLNLKDQKQVVIVNTPESFEQEIAPLKDLSVLRDAQEADEITFMLAFVTKLDEIEQISLQAAEKARGDAVVWFAYPKASSKRYQCEFNRDTGWEAVGRAGFEPVRQVAIDEDWSALRFRRVEYIKKLTRSTLGALSEEGKARTKKN